MSAHQYDEGHTVAGWTGFGIAIVGSAVLGLGVILVSAPVLAGGFAVVAVSVLVTWGLHLTGWGKPPGIRPRDQWPMRTRDLSARDGHPGCVGCRLAGRTRGLGRMRELGAAWTAVQGVMPGAQAGSETGVVSHPTATAASGAVPSAEPGAAPAAVPSTPAARSAPAAEVSG